MNFRPYRETPYRDWTIQHVWRTSLERPGPDGFDRTAVKGDLRVEQGDLTWTAFTQQLDTIDGIRLPPQPLQALRSTPTPAPPPVAAKPSRRRRGEPDPSLQSLFPE
jgi:hypothetical protein